MKAIRRIGIRRSLELLSIMISVFGSIETASAWEAKHTYVASDSMETAFTPASQSMHYTYAKAPTQGWAIAQFAQNGHRYAQAIAWNGDTDCKEVILQVSASLFESAANVISGTAICIGYDSSSSYFQRALCDEQVEN